MDEGDDPAVFVMALEHLFVTGVRNVRRLHQIHRDMPCVRLLPQPSTSDIRSAATSLRARHPLGDSHNGFLPAIGL